MITPEGTLSLILDMANQMVEASPTLIARLDPVLPSARTFYQEIDPELGDLVGEVKIARPAIGIWIADYFLIKESEECVFARDTTLLLYISDDAQENNHQDSLMNFCNFAGKIIDDIMAPHSGSSLNFSPAGMPLQPRRTTDRDQTANFDYWEATFILRVQ